MAATYQCARGAARDRSTSKLVKGDCWVALARLSRVVLAVRVARGERTTATPTPINMLSVWLFEQGFRINNDAFVAAALRFADGTRRFDLDVTAVVRQALDRCRARVPSRLDGRSVGYSTGVALTFFRRYKRSD